MKHKVIRIVESVFARQTMHSPGKAGFTPFGRDWAPCASSTLIAFSKWESPSEFLVAQRETMKTD